jgi:hypothetical protein
VTSNYQNYLNWTPIRFYFRDGEPLVDWCYIGDTRFTQPFFTDTIRYRMRNPFSVVFRHQTTIDFLGELSNSADTTPPTGFIFHMSRCGSTLASQMLSALPSNIVISEAPPIDSIIRSYSRDAGERRQWLRWLLACFARKRFGDERSFFVKFDCWNMLDMDLISSAFPDVPWIFLYRNPVEVIVSHMRQRGSQMIPGAMPELLPDVTLAKALEMPAEVYCAKILGRICTEALERSDRGLMINYDQLPHAITGTVSEHFGIPLTQDEIDQMNEAAQFNAKTPQMTFEPDSTAKRAEASDAARDAAAKFVDPIYEQIEATSQPIPR